MKNFTLYHYTKNFPEKIKSEGLKVLNWNEYRFEIYKNIPEKFKEDFSFLTKEDCFLNSRNSEFRENLIHLTTEISNNTLLIDCYGGEYLRRFIEFNYPDLKEKLFEILKSIGYPLRIKVTVPESMISPEHLERLNQIEMCTFSGGDNTEIYLKENISSDFINQVLVL